MNKCCLREGKYYQIKPSRLVFQLSMATVSIMGTVGVAHASQEEAVHLDKIVVEGEMISADDGKAYTTEKPSATSAGLPLTVKETPQSVSVITSQRIEDQNLSNLKDVFKRSPGISVRESGHSRQNYYSRGFEVKDISIDGVPVEFRSTWGTGNNSLSSALYERVELVRGSNGLSKGSGNPAGTINLQRKRADSYSPEHSIVLETGSEDRVHTSIDLSSPLNANKTIRGRLVADLDQENSFRNVGDTRNILSYATLEADVTDNTLFSVGASNQINKSTGASWGGLPAFYDDGSRTNFDREKPAAVDWAFWNSHQQDAFAEVQHQFNNDWNAKVNITRGKLTSDTEAVNFQRSPNRETGAGVFTWPGGKFGTETKHTSVDVSVNGKYELLNRKHDVSLGASQLKRTFTSYTHNTEPYAPRPIDNFNEWKGKGFSKPTWAKATPYNDDIEKQTSLRASTRLNVSDQLKLIVGSRVTDYDKKQKLTGNKIENKHVITPYIGALYDFTDNVTGYASYTDIFEPQQERDVSGNSIDPIEGQNFELGVKASFADDRLVASTSIFKIQQKNLAIADGERVIPDTRETAYKAAEDGITSAGYEVDLSGEITPQWHVQFNWTDFDVEDAQGEDAITYQPTQVLKAFTSYQMPGALHKLTIGAGVSYENGTYDEVSSVTNPDDKVRVAQGGVSLFDAMAKYQFTDKTYAQLNIDNISDKKYFTDVGRYHTVTYGEPRSYALKVKHNF